MSVERKTIAVIGAGGLIGNQVVNALIESGACVLAVDSSEHSLNKLNGLGEASDRLARLVADITCLKSIERIFTTAENSFKGLTGAVNTAYPRNQSYGKKFFDVTYENFCDNLALHLGGYFLFMQQCAKYAASHNKEFSLVNMSSIYGVMAPRFTIYEGTDMTMPVEYAAIKSSLQHLTRYTTAYMKGTLFRANCVSPGGILAGQDEAFLEKYNKYCNNKGMLDPSDVVPTILFLLSDGARNISGQNIIVDDGFSI